MGPVWSCPDKVLVEKIGLDAVVFIRFVRMCRNLFFFLGLVGCGALIPINVIGTMRAQPDGQMPKDKVSMLTMAGILDLNWLWAHVGATWLFSLVFFFALHHGYRTFLGFRKRYFESDIYQDEVASRTIMLAGLPSSLQTDDKLFKFVNDMGFSDKPVQALVGRKVDKLPELMDKHKQTVEKLEKVVAKYFAGKLQPLDSNARGFATNVIGVNTFPSFQIPKGVHPQDRLSKSVVFVAPRSMPLTITPSRSRSSPTRSR